MNDDIITILDKRFKEVCKKGKESYMLRKQHDKLANAYMLVLRDQGQLRGVEEL